MRVLKKEKGGHTDRRPSIHIPAVQQGSPDFAFKSCNFCRRFPLKPSTLSVPTRRKPCPNQPGPSSALLSPCLGRVPLKQTIEKKVPTCSNLSNLEDPNPIFRSSGSQAENLPVEGLRGFSDARPLPVSWGDPPAVDARTRNPSAPRKDTPQEGTPGRFSEITSETRQLVSFHREMGRRYFSPFVFFSDFPVPVLGNHCHFRISPPSFPPFPSQTSLLVSISNLQKRGTKKNTNSNPDILPWLLLIPHASQATHVVI